MVVISESNPFLSYALISTSALYDTFVSASHSTSMSRSDCLKNSLAFGQVFLCTETPLPFVIYPKTSSPGTGLQQRAKRIIIFSTPFTLIPLELTLFLIASGF